MNELLDQAKELFPYTQALRRDFHIHPELGFREFRTSGIVAKELEALGLEAMCTAAGARVGFSIAVRTRRVGVCCTRRHGRGRPPSARVLSGVPSHPPKAGLDTPGGIEWGHIRHV